MHITPHSFLARIYDISRTHSSHVRALCLCLLKISRTVSTGKATYTKMERDAATAKDVTAATSPPPTIAYVRAVTRMIMKERCTSCGKQPVSGHCLSAEPVNDAASNSRSNLSRNSGRFYSERFF